MAASSATASARAVAAIARSSTAVADRSLARAAERSEQPRVRSMVSTYRAAEAQRLAAVALNQGNRAEAERQFEEADRALAEGEAVAPAPQRVFLQQQRERNSVNRRRAREAASPAEARGAALDSYDAALAAEGY